MRALMRNREFIFGLKVAPFSTNFCMYIITSETVLQTDKFYTTVRKIFELTFQRWLYSDVKQDNAMR